MSITLNSSSITNGVLVIDASFSAPANYKLRDFYVTCGGVNAYYLTPRNYYTVGGDGNWTDVQMVLTSGRDISRIALSAWPNGDLIFEVHASYKNITTGVVVEDNSIVQVPVTNTYYESAQSLDSVPFPMGVIQSPITINFAATSTIGIFDIPITLSAVDNVAVSAYLVSENGTTPAAADPRWAPAAPTSYTVAQSGNYTLYAWAKDADGNISDRVSTAATVYVPSVIASPAPDTYSTAQTVALTRANFTGGSIYYTLDGSDPTTGSAAYSTPVTIAASTALKVLAVDADGNQGEVQTFAYVVRAPLFFTAQPSLLSPADGGSVITYGTADADFEDVTATGSGVSFAMSTAILREASRALVTAGLSVSDTRQMIEAVVAAANVNVVAGSALRSVEAALAQVEAFPTVADLLTLADKVVQPFIFTAQPTLSMQTGDGGAIAYGTADTGADDVVSSADVVVQVADLLAKVEQLLTVVQAVPSVTDLMAQVEMITTTTQAEATAIDVKISGVAENLVTTAEGLATLADVQMMVNGVTSVAQATGGIVAVATYLEGVTAAINARATVTDVLTALLDVGPHVTITLISTINMRSDMLSPIQRVVYLNSPARIN